MIEWIIRTLVGRTDRVFWVLQETKSSSPLCVDIVNFLQSESRRERVPSEGRIKISGYGVSVRTEEKARWCCLSSSSRQLMYVLELSSFYVILLSNSFAVKHLLLFCWLQASSYFTRVSAFFFQRMLRKILRKLNRTTISLATIHNLLGLVCEISSFLA